MKSEVHSSAQTDPASGSEYHDDIPIDQAPLRVTKFEPRDCGVFRGSFSVEIVHFGVVIHGCGLFEHKGRRSIGLPKRKRGDRHIPVCEFSNSEAEAWFQWAAIEAADRYFAAVGK